MPLKIEEIEKQLARIKLFLFDLQGVLIPEDDNGQIIPGDLIEKLNEFATYCDNNNLTVGIITGITEGKILDKIKALNNIKVISSSLDKVSAAENICAELGYSLNETFFFGDGFLDIPLLNQVGLSFAPESASRQIKKAVDFICPGESGAERLDFLLRLLKKEKIETSTVGHNI